MNEDHKIILTDKANNYFLIGIVFCIIGLYGFSQIFFYNQEEVYRLTKNISYELLIVEYSFLAGIAVGVLSVSIIFNLLGSVFFNFKNIYTAILIFSTFCVAFFLIFWEFSEPLKMESIKFLYLYGEDKMYSPIWWMMTFYTIEAPLLALEMHLILKNNVKGVVFYMGSIVFITGIISYYVLMGIYLIDVFDTLWSKTWFIISFFLNGVMCFSSIIVFFKYIGKRNLKFKILKIILFVFILFVMSLIFIKFWIKMIDFCKLLLW